MRKFALKSLSSIVGKQQIELLIEKNICFFEEFEKEIRERKSKKYINELGSVYHLLERLANTESLPNTKFKDITPKTEIVKEYEIKTKNLRIYLIKNTDGKIIVLGGYKNRQKKDIRKFRKIKSRYLKFKNQSK